MMQKDNIKFDITYASIFRVAIVLVAIWFAVQLKAIIVTLFLSTIIAAAMVPSVEFFNRRYNLSYSKSILIVYLATMLVIGALLVLVFPPFFDQLVIFFEHFPFYVDKLTSGLTFLSPDQSANLAQNLTDIFTSQISGLFNNLVKITLSIFSGFLTFITIAVFTFYLLLERKKIKQNVHLLVPQYPKERLRDLVNDIEDKLGAWVRGQLSLSLIIGVATLVGLNLIHLLYYLFTGTYHANFATFTISLAIIAGLLEIVPILGPILAAVPAAIVAFAQDPNLGFAVIAIYIIIQQLENNLIVPVVMNRSVGLNPLLVLLSLAIGGSLLGVMGALLAVPVAAILQIIYSEYMEFKEKSQ